MLGNKKFRKCFNDVFFTKEGYASSPKAVIIVHGLLKKMPQLQECDDDDSDREKNNDSSSIFQEADAQEFFDDEGYEEEYDCKHPYIRGWERAKHILFNLPYEEALLFHAITLRMCHAFLRHDFYQKYQKALVKAFNVFKGYNDLKHKQQTLSYANNAFLQLKECVLDYIFNGHDYRAVALKNDLFTLATDLSLSLVEDSISMEKAQLLPGKVRVFKDGISISEEIESYAFALYMSADQEYVDLYAKEIQEVYLGDDWTDYEDESDDWYKKKYGYYGSPGYEYEDEEEYEDFEKELSPEESEIAKMEAENKKIIDKIIKEFEKKVTALDIEQDVLFHCININMMERVVKPRIYSKYLKTVRNLISNFNSSMDTPKLLKARKNTDKLFLSRFGYIYTEADFNVTKGKIEEFYLLSSAFIDSFHTVNKMSKYDISQIISPLSYNEILKLFTGENIENLTSQCLDSAREKILSLK